MNVFVVIDVDEAHRDPDVQVFADLDAATAHARTVWPASPSPSPEWLAYGEEDPDTGRYVYVIEREVQALTAVAAELGRLRAENAELHEQLGAYADGRIVDAHEIDNLRREITRLRTTR